MTVVYGADLFESTLGKFRVQIRQAAPQRVTLRLTAADGTTAEAVTQVGR